MPTDAPEQDPDVPETPTSHRPDRDTEQSTFTVTARWLAQRQVNVLCIIGMIVVPLVSLYFVSSSIKASKSATWVFNTDAAGVTLYAPVEMANVKSRLFQEIVMQAIESYLKRNPKGLSSPEAAYHFFVGQTRQSLESELSKNAKDRERRNLYDQPEFDAQPRIMNDSVKSPTFRVTGFIIRSGVLDSLPQRDVGDFKMQVELAPQPQFDVKGLYPYVVAQYRFLVTWRSDGHSEEYVSVPGAKPSVAAKP